MESFFDRRVDFNKHLILDISFYPWININQSFLIRFSETNDCSYAFAQKNQNEKETACSTIMVNNDNREEKKNKKKCAKCY